MEYWDIYNRKGKKTLRVRRKGQKLLPHEFHLVVEGWIQVKSNVFLIQQRSHNKKLFPEMWGCSVSGSVLAGEEPIAGIIRETKEELAITLIPENISLKRIIVEENTIFYIYLIEQNVKKEDIVLQKDEVMDVKFATVDEIYKMIEKKEFIYLDYYEKFFSNL